MGDAGEKYRRIFSQNHEAKEQYDPSALNELTHYLTDVSELPTLKHWFLTRHESIHELDEISSGQEFELLCQKKLESLGCGAIIIYSPKVPAKFISKELYRTH